VIRPFAATSLEHGRFLTVRNGALLALDAPLNHFGLVEAECAEQTILVYTSKHAPSAWFAPAEWLKQFRSSVI
jgi:hypothetical protein